MTEKRPGDLAGQEAVLLEPPVPSALWEDTQIQQQMVAAAEIWERFKETVTGWSAVLEQTAMALLEGTLDDELRRQARREAHRLASVVGTFGFTEGARLAREMELLLQAVGTLEQTQALRFADLVVALGKELERPLHIPPPMQRGPADTRPLLLVVDDERELAEQLAVEAMAQRLRVEIVQSLPAARQAVWRERPHVILLDLSVAETAAEGLTALAALATQAPHIPLLVMAGRDTFDDRVAVARAGGRGFLPKPMHPAQLLEAVTFLLEPTWAAPRRILAVDDDPEVLAVLHGLLVPHGFMLTTLDDPRRFWDTLEETAPALLILDVDMPHLAGTELCRIVRQAQRWRELPVLLLTSRADVATVQQLYAAGADDYVTKPITGPELVACIHNRLERSRLLSTLADNDLLTGLANQRKATQILGQFLRLAVRHRQPLSLVLVDLDHCKQMNQQYGYATGNDVLHRLGAYLLRSFRSEDVVARWGGAEFLIGMYGMPRDGAVDRLAAVLESLREEAFTSADGTPFHVTFSAGVAACPSDGTDLRTLYRAAHQALYQAKEAGRNRVLPAGWRPDQAQAVRHVDIVLVDSDEAVAGLLLHALETRGYRHAWLQDGAAAVASLTGPHPRLHARVVLLAVSLPGLDGLTVLRRLGQDGLLEHTRVIMLTFRATESEVLAALELGAFDHIAKPFSLPVLMQRIRHTLQV